MSDWVLKGLKTGIKTTRYPDKRETRPGVSPGLPVLGQEIAGVADLCPTNALSAEGNSVTVDYCHCVHCFRCARPQGAAPVPWEYGYEWAAAEGEGVLERHVFGSSLYVLVVDAGDCGACLSEIAQLNNPYYNMHRLGFFITPTPRSADILLIIGPVTAHMRLPLRKAYEAMPTPKRVVAVGACALSGGVFGPSFVSGSGAASVIPVDVLVPGCPPPPLAILHGLLVAVGRKPPAQISATAGPAKAEPEEAA